MARIVSVSGDLMLASRVEASLAAAGHEVTTVGTLDAASLEGVDLVVADLDAGPPGPLGALPVPVLGYYSHVEAATREAALAAGVAQAVPRSRMARELPVLVEKLLAG